VKKLLAHVCAERKNNVRLECHPLSLVDAQNDDSIVAHIEATLPRHGCRYMRNICGDMKQAALIFFIAYMLI
jgi:hypothetical protein